MRKVLLTLTAISLLFAMATLATSVSAATISGKQVVGKLNINTASSKELQLLPYVGQKVAQRIIKYRETHGQFKAPKELKKVKGIGNKTFTKLAGMIKVSGNSDLRLAKKKK